jgi:hypothetical protein
VFQVIAHQLSPHPAKRFVDRGDLGEDVGTIAVLVDHLLESAKLALYATEAFEVSRFDFRIDLDGFAGIAGMFPHGASTFGAAYSRRYGFGFCSSRHAGSLLASG